MAKKIKTAPKADLAPIEQAAPHLDSKEARDERKAAAKQAYAANPPESSRAARKARGPLE